MQNSIEIEKALSNKEKTGVSTKIGKYRWTICGLIFFATTINYLDRQVISLLKSTLSADMHWNDADYADIEMAFQFFYAFV